MVNEGKRTEPKRNLQFRLFHTVLFLELNCDSNIKVFKIIVFFFELENGFIIMKYLYCVVFSKLQRNHWYIGNKITRQILFCPKEYRRRWINRHFGYKKHQCTT